MSTGVRTILISRWRPGGQSSFDLVREFRKSCRISRLPPPGNAPCNCSRHSRWRWKPNRA